MDDNFSSNWNVCPDCHHGTIYQNNPPCHRCGWKPDNNHLSKDLLKIINKYDKTSERYEDVSVSSEFKDLILKLKEEYLSVLDRLAEND